MQASAWEDVIQKCEEERRRDDNRLSNSLEFLELPISCDEHIGICTESCRQNEIVLRMRCNARQRDGELHHFTVSTK